MIFGAEKMRPIGIIGHKDASRRGMIAPRTNAIGQDAAVLTTQRPQMRK